MPEASRVTAGSTIQINDLNQLIDLLEGGNSMTGAFNLVSTSGEDFIIKLADAAGARSILIKDSSGATVASINSNGEATFTSTTSSGAMVIPSSTSPGDTTEGSIQWDSNDDRLVIGDGATTQTFYPGDPSSINRVALKTSTQDFTTTTYADVTSDTGGANGDIAFALAANTTYLLRLLISVTAMGTQNSGGLKLGLTGPASPTRITVFGKIPYHMAQGSDSNADNEVPVESRLHQLYASNSTFGQFIALNNAATPATGSASGATTGLWEFEIYIANGANAGDVTLQAAQNTAAGTTTFDEVVAVLTKLTAEAA